MSSEFEIQVAFIQDIAKQASLDSQRLTTQMRRLRQGMEEMQRSIEGKNEAILRQMAPRILQLEEKMECYWVSIEGMDKLAWGQLGTEQQVFEECNKIVKDMEERTDNIIARI